MKIAVEIHYDKETDQWCVGMVAPPWVASCGKTRTAAKQKFVEAFHAYFEAPRKARPQSRLKKTVELVTVA